MQPTTPKIILLAFALIAIFMPHAFTAEYNAPATLTSLGTQPWTADEKTQALVGSSTVDFAAQKLDVSGVATFTGFVKLGDAATGIKMKVLTGTTAAAEGGDVAVSHGVTGDNIISATCKVHYATNTGNFPGFPSTESEFNFYQNDSAFVVRLSATNSGSILSKPFTILIWYKE